MTAQTHPSPELSIDIAGARADFPIFLNQMNENPIVFLDSAASAQKPWPVIDAFNDMFTQCYANVHRGIYALSAETTLHFEEARGKVARFIGAKDNEIVFTRNGTESINLVAASWGGANLKAGDEILITALEHHANIVPWQLIAEKTGAKLVVAPITDKGDVLASDVIARITPKTKIIAVSHMSNALGTILPIAEIIAAAKKAGIVTLIDGCQAICHIAIDVKKLGCDFYVFSGHKLYGPTGIGVLYGREELLNAMPPYMGGGDMIDTVTFEKTTYRESPTRFEAGTPAIAEAVALGVAVDYVTTLGLSNIARYEDELYAYALDALSKIDGLVLHGTAKHRASILSFTTTWGSPADVGMILDKQGICVRVGHHCCMPLMAELKVPATIRASIGLYNDRADIDALVAGLHTARKLLA